MNIKPLADRVLVKPAAAEEKTVAGIIIPDTAKEKPLKGEVLAVGNGTKDEEMVLNRALWQIFRQRGGNRRRKVSHHAPERCARRARLIAATQYLYYI